MVLIPVRPIRDAVGAACLAALVAALLLAPSPAGAAGQDEEPRPLVVKVSPSICFEGGAVRAQVRLPRDAGNRALRVEVDGEGYYSSSTLQLDGEASPAVYERRWLDLPAGNYVVNVSIVHVSGQTTGAHAEFTVVDPRAQGPPPRH